MVRVPCGDNHARPPATAATAAAAAEARVRLPGGPGPLAAADAEPHAGSDGRANPGAGDRSAAGPDTLAANDDHRRARAHHRRRCCHDDISGLHNSAGVHVHDEGDNHCSRHYHLRECILYDQRYHDGVLHNFRYVYHNVCDNNAKLRRILHAYEYDDGIPVRLHDNPRRVLRLHDHHRLRHGEPVRLHHHRLRDG